MKLFHDLLESQLFEDALELLEYVYERDSEEYQFYLAYLQVQLGWTEEAMETLLAYQLKFRGSAFAGTVAGFLADIYRHEGHLYEAYDEITKALRFEPDCPLIQSKVTEIQAELEDFLAGLFVYLSVLLRQGKRGI